MDEPRYIAQVETDVFCNDCGFNLHTQRVWQDDRLGIFVCRCPECGSHHPAGQAISATRPWLRRVGMLMLAGWVGFVVVAVLGILLVSFTLHVANYESRADYAHLTPDGLVADTRWQPLPDGTSQNVVVINGIEQPGVQWAQVERTRYPVPPGHPGNWRNPTRGNMNSDWWEAFWFTVVQCLAGVFVGGLLTVALWHRPRWNVLLIVAVGVVLPAMAWVSIVFTNERTQYIGGWLLRNSALFATVSLVGGVVTVLIGRMFVRGLLTLLLPVQARRTFSFLWEVDGRPLP
ncbi:MAG: hypothetical protein AAF656_04050 [Planctomycetota bacterium]